MVRENLRAKKIVSLRFETRLRAKKASEAGWVCITATQAYFPFLVTHKGEGAKGWSQPAVAQISCCMAPAAVTVFVCGSRFPFSPRQNSMKRRKNASYSGDRGIGGTGPKVLE